MNNREGSLNRTRMIACLQHSSDGREVILAGLSKKAPANFARFVVVTVSTQVTGDEPSKN